MSTALAGKVAWVTGGGTGIGEAGALALAAAGAHVVLSGRRVAELDRVAAKIHADGGTATVAALDVADETAVRQAADTILAGYGRIDILLASAGVNVPDRSFATLSSADWRMLLDVNLSGVMHAVQAALPAMRRQRDGLVMIVSSWAARHPMRLAGPAYTATKQAVVGLSHALNIEEHGNGIRSCAILPGEVATEILAKRPVPPPPEEVVRLLQPEDVGKLIRTVAEMPARACVNEIVVSPTWNRSFAAMA